MKGKLKKEQIKKIIFLAAVLAAGILIYVLFGRDPVEEEIITFTEAEDRDTVSVTLPREEEVFRAFEKVLPEDSLKPESRGKDAAEYLLTVGETSVRLTLQLASDRVTALNMEFILPKFPEPLPANATAVEKGLREKRQIAFEDAVTDCVFYFSFLTERFETLYPNTGRSGLAADSFREALMEGRSERMEWEGWEYDLLSLRNKEQYTAKIAVTYLGDQDNEG